jgi:large conductance mechanosensitive channel
MLQEFKAFIKRGNVLDFAVAVIIAGAFGAVVKSFTADILMPPIGMALGGVDFSDLKIILQAAEGEDVAEVAIRWGLWIKYIIDFLIIAFILFMIVKAYNKFDPPAPAPAEPTGPSQEDLLAEIRDLLKK